MIEISANLRAGATTRITLRAALALRDARRIATAALTAWILALVAVLGLASLGSMIAAESGIPSHLALALAAAAVTALVLWTVHGPSGALQTGGTTPHPHRAIDISSPLSQSDPDAPGHARPRAPQGLASAA